MEEKKKWYRKNTESFPYTNFPLDFLALDLINFFFFLSYRIRETTTKSFFLFSLKLVLINSRQNWRTNNFFFPSRENEKSCFTSFPPFFPLNYVLIKFQGSFARKIAGNTKPYKLSSNSMNLFLGIEKKKLSTFHSFITALKSQSHLSFAETPTA